MAGDKEDLPFCDEMIQRTFTSSKSELGIATTEHYNYNASSFEKGNVTEKLWSSTAAAGIDHQWFETVIPIVCVLGIMGNILTLLILTRPKMLAGMDRLEKSATYGLVALALSDMLFCVTVCPHSFIAISRREVEPAYGYALYYRVYGIAAINLFLMISTWLVVTISVQRFMVVVYPFQARHLLSGCNTVLSILLVYVASVVCTAPHFMHSTVRKCQTLDGRVMLQIADTKIWQPEVTIKLRWYMIWIWPIIADFIPLLVLVVCNSTLIRELRMAAKQRRLSCNGRKVKGVNHRVTLTLVVIVVMFFVLVCPAEILKYINPFKAWGVAGHVVASVANVMQTLNFACNFALYCAVNRHFRQTLTSLVTCCTHRRHTGERSESRSHYSSAGRTTFLRLQTKDASEETMM